VPAAGAVRCRSQDQGSAAPGAPVRTRAAGRSPGLGRTRTVAGRCPGRYLLAGRIDWSWHPTPSPERLTRTGCIRATRRSVTKWRATAVRPAESRVAPEPEAGRSGTITRHESARVVVQQLAANTQPYMQEPGRPAPEPVVRTSRSAEGPVAARRHDQAEPPTASAAGRAWRPDSQVRRQQEPSPGHPPKASRASTRARTMRACSAAAGSSAWRLDRTAISGARQPGPASLETPNLSATRWSLLSSAVPTGVPER
jgi:hypothetical protein